MDTDRESFQPSKDPNWKAPTDEEVKQALEEGERNFQDMKQRSRLARADCTYVTRDEMNTRIRRLESEIGAQFEALLTLIERKPQALEQPKTKPATG